MITYLKIIVIVLGVMIAAGLVVIGIKLVEKSSELAELTGDEGADATGKRTPARRTQAPCRRRRRFPRSAILGCPRARRCGG